MKNLLSFTFMAASLLSLRLEAEPVYDSTYLISGSSRPCCNFSLDSVGQALGFSKAIGKDEVGPHYFDQAGKKDNVGILYTCKAGFIDLSHVRDNADWSAHVYSNLPEWLGSGKEIRARREGGFKKRAVFFPVVDPKVLATLTEDDREKIAVSVGFSLALLHEITTAFPIAVTIPAAFFVYERSSSFSVEDAFSNLLGNWMGVKAARSPLPYNKAMTEIIESTLTEFDGQSRKNTLNAYQLVRNDWWTSRFYGTFSTVKRRNFTYEGVVTPHLVEVAPFCSNEMASTLQIPDMLSNGTSVHDYYEIRGVLKKKLLKLFKKWGVRNQGPVLTQKDYPAIIEVIKTKFVKDLGKEILFTI